MKTSKKISYAFTLDLQQLENKKTTDHGFLSFGMLSSLSDSDNVNLEATAQPLQKEAVEVLWKQSDLLVRTNQPELDIVDIILMAS